MKKVNTVKHALLMLAVVATALGQEKTDLQTVDSTRSIMCEYTAAVFDGFVQNVPRDSTTIIVGKTGLGEQSSTSRDRVLKAKSYWLDYYRRVRPEMSAPVIIAATDLNSGDEGQLTFYVDGKARLQVAFKKNRKFHTAPCYEERRRRH
jgi:hypothetical protein